MSLSDNQRALLEELQAEMVFTMLDRGDYHEMAVGFWLQFITQFERGNRHKNSEQYRWRREFRWYEFMVNSGVHPGTALVLAGAMHNKFATYEPGISWLQKQAKGSHSTHLQKLGYNQVSLVTDALDALPAYKKIA